MTTQTATRRNHFAAQRSEIMTTPDRRNNAGRQPDNMMTTLCPCGERFNSRPGQIYHSAKCRKLAYEKSDKARARRVRYFQTDKGQATLRRYRDTGAPAKSSREYRERSSFAWMQLDSAWRKYGLEDLKPEQAWTEEEIRKLNVYALWARIRFTAYRVAPAPVKDRLDAFFDKLAETKETLCRTHSDARASEALRQS